MEHDLTRGNVLKTIAVFALPYMLSYFLQMLYGMADLYMMGQFSGAAGITAVGNGAQTLYIITVTLVGLAMGTTVIVGHAVGSRRFDRAETAIGNTITLFMGVSVVLAVVLLALCPQIVALIGTPAEAVEGTAAYLRICFIGIPFIAAYNILSAIFRGLGDSRSPMYVIGVACIINIALDFLFIGHMGLGPVGAALGTVTADSIAAAGVPLLQSLGMTFRKAEYIMDFADKIRSGAFNLESVKYMSDADAIRALSSLKGIGVWTAEMILLFCLQRPNVFSYDDLAIQRGLRMVYHHRKIDRKLFEKYHRRFSPYCSVASLYLWEVSGGAIPGMRDYALVNK